MASAEQGWSAYYERLQRHTEIRDPGDLPQVGVQLKDFSYSIKVNAKSAEVSYTL